jgi:hypothetical protein
MADDQATALAEREARRHLQERFMAVYEDARDELLRIPGVVEVGVALRERGGVLTDEPVFRIEVVEKLPDSEIPPGERIPKVIRGFPTDVIKHRERTPIIGFDDEDDETTYKMKAGGIRIGPSVGSTTKGRGQGTLGCFARRNSDNEIVMLSNHHVLMQREHYDGAARGKDNGLGVGQPDHSASLCCTCNDIATTANGDNTLDCAIAVLKPNVKFAAKVRRIKRSDGTDELSGDIAGSDAPVRGDEVWKVGCTTGLTRGKVSQIAPVVEITPIAPFKKIAGHGDSGSVIVNALTSKVVGLLKQIDKPTGTLGYATSIVPILTAMNITILETADIGEFDVADWDEEQRLGAVRQPAPEEVFAAVADRLRRSDSGTELLALYRRHQSEISTLVNHCRPVTVAWQRGQGPAFLAAIMRSIREPIYQLPMSLNGVTREEFARRLQKPLAEHGRESLRADLAAHGETLIGRWLTCSTFDELLQAWEHQYAPSRCDLSVTHSQSDASRTVR